MEGTGERKVTLPEEGRLESHGDGSGGALVDASTAVDALAGINDGDVIDGDGSLGADVHACTACNALGIDCNCHVCYLWLLRTSDLYLKHIEYVLGVVKKR